MRYGKEVLALSEAKKGGANLKKNSNTLFIEALAKVVIPVKTGIQRFCNTGLLQEPLYFISFSF